VRSFLHFLWDYRRNCTLPSEDNIQENDLPLKFLKKFSMDLRELYDDVYTLQESLAQTVEVTDSDLLQTALVSRFGSWLCGIWDVWEPLGVTPGDVGYMIRGADRLRPRFKRLFNLAPKVQDNPIDVTINLGCYPRTAPWTSDVLETGLVR
jgi:hypothetical protein